MRISRLDLSEVFVKGSLQNKLLCCHVNIWRWGSFPPCPSPPHEQCNSFGVFPPSICARRSHNFIDLICQVFSSLPWVWYNNPARQTGMFPFGQRLHHLSSASLSAVIQSFNSCSLQAGRLLTVHVLLAWIGHFYFIYSFILHDWSYQPPVLWREEKSLQLKLWWSYLSKFALLSDSWLQLYISYVRLLWSI